MNAGRPKLYPFLMPRQQKEQPEAAAPETAEAIEPDREHELHAVREFGKLWRAILRMELAR